MINIFIANLDWSITSEDLKTTFSTFGEVHYAHVVFEKDTKRSRGYGYVEMESAEAAISAITALNGMEINGRAIDVKVASPKTNRPKKEAKAPEKKPFQKKPGFNKGGGGFQNRDNRGGYQSRDNGGGYQKRDGAGSYQNRENGGGYQNREYNNDRSSDDRNNQSSSSQSGERVMRPRRTNTDGASRYERVERINKNTDEQN